MNETVLVVDDEPQIREILRAFLSSDGYAVAEAGTGAEALALLERDPGIAVVLLDIGLPDRDGIEVLRQLRTHSEVYVILVTARAEEVDRIVGLSVGADDYITKPFSPREVVARVKAVLRRRRELAATGQAGAVLVFDGVSIDRTRREVLVGGAPVQLTALDFDLLVALAAAPGRVFSRSQLLEQVWGYDFFGDDRVVDVHIRAMRRALGDDAAAPRMVGTVRGVGYKFLLEPAKGAS